MDFIDKLKFVIRRMEQTRNYCLLYDFLKDSEKPVLRKRIVYSDIDFIYNPYLINSISL